ncbi:MAG: hypothetical protein WCF77_04525 [Minisyncoccia bacterium]|jgi:hypothetical protein
MADQNTLGALPSAPPPPQEVKVRTLKSDLASIAQSGGGLPRYQDVKIAQTPAQKAKNLTGLITVVAIIVLVAVIVAIAVYFVNQLVLKK